MSLTREYSTKSWHYRLATVYGNFNTYDASSNICPYARAVLWGILKIIAVVFVGAWVAWIALAPWLWMYIYFILGLPVEPDDCTNIGLVIYLTLIATAILVGIVIGLHKFFSLKSIDAGIHKFTNSFVVEAYKSWHDKT